jgi:hypothetical protein
MAKKKDRTANMQKRETLRIGGYIGTPGEIWLKSELLGELVSKYYRGLPPLRQAPADLKPFLG